MHHIYFHKRTQTAVKSEVNFSLQYSCHVEPLNVILSFILKREEELKGTINIFNVSFGSLFLIFMVFLS